MLEAVKPVLLEKVDNIWSQFLTRVSSLLFTQPCHSPVTLPVVYPNSTTTLSLLV
jgi:hypothetical protein